MAKRSTEFDSVILVNTKRKLKLYITIIIGIFALGMFLSSPYKNQPELFIGVLSVVGIFYSLFPKTEHWQYKAWQNHPSLFEQDLDDNH